MNDKPLEQYTPPDLSRFIEELRRDLSILSTEWQRCVMIRDKRIAIRDKRITELEDAIREHSDSFLHDKDELDWTTEDEKLWSMVQEKTE